jgi:hypothetical protein
MAAQFDTFLQVNAELTTLMNTAKLKRKCVRAQKKRIREHMEEQGLDEYAVGDYVFTLKEEDKFRFNKRAFVDWLQELPGEEPDDMITLIADFEEQNTQQCSVFKCKRRKIQE